MHVYEWLKVAVCLSLWMFVFKVTVMITILTQVSFYFSLYCCN